MKNNQKILIILFLSIVTLLIVISGPTVGIDDTVHQSNLLSSNLTEMDNNINNSEARFADIVPGTEKKILWSNPETRQKTEYSIIFLHGFSASRQELSPLPENLAAHLNANIFLTRLTGHGRQGSAMLEGSVNKYINDANEAFEIGKRIGNKLVIVGNSMGALLATWLATKYNSEIFCLVLISPNYGLHRSEAELMLFPWGNLILHIVEGSEYSYETFNDDHRKYWTSSFPSKSLLSMMGLVKLVRTLKLETVTAPQLTLYSPQDKIVSTSDIETTFKKFNSKPKQLITIDYAQDPEQHILAGDVLSPTSTNRLTRRILNFINSLEQ